MSLAIYMRLQISTLDARTLNTRNDRNTHSLNRKLFLYL